MFFGQKIEICKFPNKTCPKGERGKVIWGFYGCKAISGSMGQNSPKYVVVKSWLLFKKFILSSCRFQNYTDLTFSVHTPFRTNLGPQDPGSEIEKITCSKAIFNVCGALKAYLKLNFKPYSIISNHLNFLKISIFGQRLPL